MSPIQSLIIHVINKLGDRERVVRLQTELDDMKSCYQLINIMTKFKEETMRWLYIFIKKAKVVLAKYMKTGRAHDAYCPVSQV